MGAFLEPERHEAGGKTSPRPGAASGIERQESGRAFRHCDVGVPVEGKVRFLQEGLVRQVCRAVVEGKAVPVGDEHRVAACRQRLVQWNFQLRVFRHGVAAGVIVALHEGDDRGNLPCERLVLPGYGEDAYDIDYPVPAKHQRVALLPLLLQDVGEHACRPVGVGRDENQGLVLAGKLLYGFRRPDQQAFLLFLAVHLLVLLYDEVVDGLDARLSVYVTPYFLLSDD